MSPLDFIAWTIAAVTAVVGVCFVAVLIGAAFVVVRHQMENDE